MHVDSTTARLAQAYDDWLFARQLINRVRGALPALSQPETLLENALMRASLRVPKCTPRSLFGAIELEDLAVASGVVGAPGSEARLLTLIRAELDARADAGQPPLVELGEASLRAGEFETARVEPVDRLVRFALEHFSPDEAATKVAACALTYAAIYSKTRHIGPPQVVYDAFYDWGVRNEGFASPFNARLLGKPGARFFSLFPHVDRDFGGQGSFYHADLGAYDGAWSIDPPFLTESLRLAEDRMRAHRESGGSEPMLFIGPSAYAFTMAHEEHVMLKAQTHHYEALDGELHPLPVDVSIYRVGSLAQFDAEAIRSGYLPAR